MTLPRPADWITQKTLRSTAIMSMRPEMILPSRRITRTASSRESLDQSGTGATGRRAVFIREPLVPPAVREEPLMSTVHRILLSAFARSDRPVSGRRPAGNGSPTAQQSTGSDVLSCTPWAGLYVEGPGAS